jgi:hypothetical protein
MDGKAAIRFAIDNIARHGDTDVFPHPLENHIFFDLPDDAAQMLEELDLSFEKHLKDYPPDWENSLAVVGYTGFRSATQMDPMWNAYLLSLVIGLGHHIEAARISKDKETVFSYRFKPDPTEATVFDREYTWTRFQARSIQLARNFAHVVTCDVSDFYPRIYHHRLENALKKAAPTDHRVGRVMAILQHVAGGVSYGLPVGGPAARLLSELLLNRVDRLLLAEGVTFVRYSDDYHLFASTREEAYDRLVYLNEKLLDNEGLLLQKTKTRIVSSLEFLGTSELAEENKPEDHQEAQARRFLSLRLHYDPYSVTKEADYRELKDQLNQFDIVGMLAREVGKTRIHQPITRRLISSVRHLDAGVKDAAVKTLVQSLNVLYPVFPQVMLLLKSVLAEISPDLRVDTLSTVRELIRSKSFIVRPPVNLAFALRVLSDDASEEAESLLGQLYNSVDKSTLRRDVILIMARRGADYWLSDVRRRFQALSSWERRAVIVGSFILEDEGRHWRRQVADSLSPMESLAQKWASQRKQSNTWSIPI